MIHAFPFDLAVVAVLGYPDGRAACGGPVRAILRSALVRLSGDPDSSLLIEINAGLTLGGESLSRLTETCSLPRCCDICSGLRDPFDGIPRAHLLCKVCRSVIQGSKTLEDYPFFKYDMAFALAFAYLLMREDDRRRASVRVGSSVPKN